MQTAFPEITAVPPLGLDDEPALADLAALFEGAGLLETVGVHLLHEHFPLRRNETLLEEVDLVERSAVTRPTSVRDLPADAVSSLWHAAGANGVTALMYTSNGAMIPLIDPAALAAAAFVLHAHEAHARIGLARLDLRPVTQPHELLVEISDEAARRSEIRPQPRVGEGSGRLYATTYQLHAGAGAAHKLVCKVGCFSDLKGKHSRTHDRVWG